MKSYSFCSFHISFIFEIAEYFPFSNSCIFFVWVVSSMKVKFKRFQPSTRKKIPSILISLSNIGPLWSHGSTGNPIIFSLPQGKTFLCGEGLFFRCCSFNPIPVGLIFDYFLWEGPPLKSALIELEKLKDSFG